MNHIPYPVRHTDADSITHNPLEIPGSRPKFQNVTILGGQTLTRGSVLGQITASGKFKLAASAAGDGSQTPIAVLHHDISTFDTDGSTPKDMTASIAVTGGAYNEAALVLGSGITLAAAKVALIARGFITRALGFSG